MKENELQEILEKMKKINEKKIRLKKSYEEAKNEYGENSGIARVINVNLDKTEKEEEQLKKEENLDYIYNEKLKLKKEIKELEERILVLQIDKEYADSLMKTDDKNDDTQIDEIQIQRNDKFKKLNEQIINVNNEISEKRSIIKELEDILKLFNYIENKEILDDEENITEGVNEQSQDEANIIEDISKGIQNKLEEMNSEKKDNNIIDKKIMSDKVKKMGNNIIKEMGNDYKNTYIYIEPKKELTNIDNREPEVLYKEGEELPEEQVKGLENIQDKKENINKNVNQDVKKSPQKMQKNNIFKRIIKRIKSSRKCKKIMELFEKAKDEIKLLPEKVNEVVNVKKEDMPEEEYNLFNDIPIEDLLNNMNKEKYSEADLQTIKDYANKYGEKEAKRRYRKQLSGAKITIDVKKMIEERRKKDEMEKCGFVEKVNNEDGHIERSAKENIERVEGEIVQKDEDIDFKSTNKSKIVDGEYINLE